MSIRRSLSWSFRILASFLILVGVPGPDTSAKVLFQSPSTMVIVPNLMAYWKVDGDTGGVATDSSGNANNGAYMGNNGGATISTTVPPVPSPNTSSFQFVQADKQFIDVPDSPTLSVTGALTLAAWVRRTLDNTAVQKGIIEKFDSGPTGNGYSLRIGFDDYFDFSVFNGTTQKDITTKGAGTPYRGADLNTWNHVAGVYNPSGAPQMQIFKNGVADATTSANAGQEPVAPPTDGTTSLHIGADYGSNAWEGQIDEVRIYNKALTVDEIAILNTMVQPAVTLQTATGGNSQNVLTWTAASNDGTVPVVYSVQRGTVTGVYTTVFNTNSNSTTFTDTTPVPGTQYFYTVVAVSVIPSANSNEMSATANNTPPPPPPPPRTQKLGSRHMCGCSTIMGPSWGALGALVLAASVLILPRRKR